MTPLSLTVLDLVLALLAAALLGGIIGYGTRWWLEQRRARKARAAGDDAAAAGGRAAAPWSADAPGLRHTTPRKSRPASSSSGDSWQGKTPPDVQVQAWAGEEGTGPTVLVVDDRMELRAVHSAYLRQHGYRVLTAADGETALSMVRKHNPAVVLLDHSIPRMTGIEVTRELKRDPRTERIPVLLMTAHSYGAIGAAAKQAGVSAFLPKPVDPSRVLREVERHARVDVSDA